jgi:hypothetical protein
MFWIVRTVMPEPILPAPPGLMPVVVLFSPLHIAEMGQRYPALKSGIKRILTFAVVDEKCNRPSCPKRVIILLSSHYHSICEVSTQVSLKLFQPSALHPKRVNFECASPRGELMRRLPRRAILDPSRGTIPQRARASTLALGPNFSTLRRTALAATSSTLILCAVKAGLFPMRIPY